MKVGTTQETDCIGILCVIQHILYERRDSYRMLWRNYIVIFSKIHHIGNFLFIQIVIQTNYIGSFLTQDLIKSNYTTVDTDDSLVMSAMTSVICQQRCVLMEKSLMLTHRRVLRARGGTIAAAPPQNSSCAKSVPIRQSPQGREHRRCSFAN